MKTTLLMRNVRGFAFVIKSREANAAATYVLRIYDNVT